MALTSRHPLARLPMLYGERLPPQQLLPARYPGNELAHVGAIVSAPGPLRVERSGCSCPRAPQ